MTLPNAILFPQVMLPLFIFEPRYRRMLKDVLEGERVFAVAMQKPGSTKGTPSNVAGLGLVRAAVTHADGTSHLILQGMARIELTETVKHRPYRLEKFRLLQTEGNNNVVVDALTEKVLDLVAERFKSGLPFPILNQLLKMDEKKATGRLIKAIENPYTTILGHMTGRQLLIRPGYPVNFQKVIDACAANNVVIEINANPYRLDMDWSQIPYALKKGVMISINPDAHSITEIDNIRWGVAAARKGGLTKDMTWNAMPLKRIEKWISR